MSPYAPAPIVLHVHQRALSIAVDHPEIGAYLARVFAPLRALEALEADAAAIRWLPTPHIRFGSEAEAIVAPGTIDGPRAAAFYGARQLIRRSLRRQAPWAALYAAGVAIEGRAVAIVGPSGSGKTTLACALVARGALLYGDEFVFIDVENGSVAPFPCALSVREGGARLLDNPALHAGDDIDPFAAFGPLAIAQPAPLGALLLLGPRHAQPSVTPMSRTLAALEVRRMLHARTEDFSRLGDVLDRLAAVPAFRIHAGAPAETALRVRTAIRAVW
ncbi:MAG: hypothetical protein NVS2B17_26460 [Candidatus Velthaea sp.]